MKIHENICVKDIFHHHKSNRMKVYTHIYLACFSGLQNFVPPETIFISAKNHFPFYLLHIYPSVDFSFKIPYYQSSINFLHGHSEAVYFSHGEERYKK